MTTTQTPDTAIVAAIRQRVSGVTPDEKQRPGPVVPRATIRLHTYLAHQLFFGRAEDASRPYRDQCFASFGANLNALWTCAQADDPYADAKLIQIEEQINVVREKILTLCQMLDNLLGSLEDSGIRVDTHQSIRPVDIPISFRAVHAAVAVQILGSLDRVLQKALMARHFGLVTAQDWQRVLDQSVSPMRHLFKLAQFRASGATRDDFAANNARARAAEEKLGQLPADILQGTRRPLLGPRTNATTSLLFGEINTRDLSLGDGDSIVAQSLRAMTPSTDVKTDSLRESVAKTTETAPKQPPSARKATAKRSGGAGHE